MPAEEESSSPKGKTDGKLPVMEIFGPTVQGEGAMIGVRTHFIRLGGCDYRCRMCDSMHAVLPEMVKANAKWSTPEDILVALKILDVEAGELEPGWVTLSGGNPAIWDCGDLVGLLKHCGYRVAIETQGSIWPTWLNRCDQVTVSPKGPGMGEADKFDPGAFAIGIHGLIYPQACVKIVVFDQRDLEFAVGVDEILNRISFPRGARYLSSGNAHPPQVLANSRNQNQELHMNTSHMIGSTTVHQAYLSDYQSMLEDWYQDKRLGHWKFLPQLHVVLYDNQAGR